MSSHEEEASIDSRPDERKDEVPPEEHLQNIPPKVAGPPPVVNKTGIDSRLSSAVKAAMKVNRSSDLVPLSHYFNSMRKDLKSAIAAAKKYKASVLPMDKARMDMVMNLSSLAKKSPIFNHVGNTEQEDSYVAIAEDASKQTKNLANSYQDLVVDYRIEWERVISSRVDKGLEETGKLHARLNHYENKVEGLRKKVNSKEDSPKGIPKKLQEKLDRNEKKLDGAWKEHERSASKLCDLLEQVTARGWKDLAPLVLNGVQWEVERSSGDYDVFARLPGMVEAMMETVEKVNELPEDRSVAIALVPTASEAASETTGSYHSKASEEEEVTVEEEFAPESPGASSKEADLSKVPEQVPQSPDRVVDLHDQNKGAEI